MTARRSNTPDPCSTISRAIRRADDGPFSPAADRPRMAFQDTIFIFSASGAFFCFFRMSFAENGSPTRFASANS